MKEAPQNHQDIVRKPLNDNDEMLEAMLGLVPENEEIASEELDWEHGYMTGVNDSRDVMRVKILNFFRRDYQRIPDRIEENTDVENRGRT